MAETVLILHADEEQLAEQLADPISKAGFDVVQKSVVPVGELAVDFSKVLKKGGSIVLCGTTKLVGSGWPNRLVDSAQRLDLHIFGVQMEDGAYLEGIAEMVLDRGIYRYWQDPSKAINDLLVALRRSSPLDDDAMGNANKHQEESLLEPPNDFIDYLSQSVVRIFNDNGQIVGSGFLIDETLILTTAHVIAQAMGLKDDFPTTTHEQLGHVFHIDFPFIKSREIYTAHNNYLASRNSGGGSDRAFLRLDNDLPIDTKPIALLTEEKFADQLWGHRFWAYVPSGLSDPGDWINGTLLEPQDNRWLKVKINSIHSFGPVFSGTPIWDEQWKCFIGMGIELGNSKNDWIGYIAPSDYLASQLSQISIYGIKLNTVRSNLEDQKERPKEEKTEGQKDSISIGSRIDSVLRKIAPEALDRNAICDLPISLLKDDKLGFNIYIRALRDFIASQDTATPLTIGIDSHWGTGKTSLMQMLKTELDPNQTLTSNVRNSMIWILWCFLYLFTIPFWLIGKVLIRIAEMANYGKGTKLEEIEKGLNWDPSAVSEERIKTWSTWAKFWAWIGKRHSPMISSSLPTIWFNAWKFDQEEMLWAAMALTVIDNLKKRYGPLQRVLFWFRLTWKRFSPLRAIRIVIFDVFMPIILLLAALSVNIGAIGSKDPNSSGVLKEVLLQIKDFLSLMPIQPIITDNPWIWNLMFFIGALVWGFKQYSSILNNPFQISAKSLVDKPNYEEKIGFIGSFQKDFEAIVSIATIPLIGWKPAKLVIFIDDLDRCKPPKAADIILAINQFLDSPGCVFVIGMDSTAVVASIEIKYKALFKKIKEENMDVVSPGRLFLDKIVQINFHIPKTTMESLNELAISIIHYKKINSNLSNRGSSVIGVPETQPSSAPKNLDSNSEPSNEATQPIALLEPIDKSTIGAAFEGSMQKLDKFLQNDLAGMQDIASYSSDDVSQSILTGASLLQNNPRQLKRFINQFRLTAYICHEKGLFRKKIMADVEEEGLNLERLAIWVAWSIRWPELAKELFDGGWQKETRDYLHEVSEGLSNDGSWNDAAIFNKLHQDLIERRLNISKIEYPNHWLTLPWDRWFEDNSFKKSVKRLGCFWETSKAIAFSDDGNQDLLELMLTMSSSLMAIAEPTRSI
ncbi:MAG: P-loop NTPase fold protein [Methanothrix sp.]|nr:P-loop NTPase fold protein [Methanothrix sp.]MDD4446286.1 P-loop NTPase fold protein [Methanothrix sp.]